MAEELIPPGYRRVTEILYPYSGLENIDRNIVENAANRGSRVHHTCEAIVRGLPAFTDDETAPYVECFRQWYNDQKIVTIEERFFCDVLKITGKCDMIIDEGNGLTILDLKTSYRPSKTWPLQGAAYAYMAKAKGYDIKNIHFLHLRKNKLPRIYEYTYEDNIVLFRKALDIYNYFWPKGYKC